MVLAAGYHSVAVVWIFIDNIVANIVKALGKFDLIKEILSELISKYFIRIDTA